MVSLGIYLGLDISQLHKTNLKLENKPYFSYISRERELKSLFFMLKLKQPQKRPQLRQAMVTTIKTAFRWRKGAS